MYKIISYSCFVFFAFILWIIYKADTGQSSIFFDLVKKIPYGDKLGHFILFGFLTLGMNFVTKFKVIRLGYLSIFTGTLFVFLFVLIEEISQYYLPSRTFDLLDLCADTAGIIIFHGISYNLNKRILLNI